MAWREGLLTAAGLLCGTPLATRCSLPLLSPRLPTSCERCPPLCRRLRAAGKWAFTLGESADGRALVLDVALGKYLDTSAVQADVQPRCVRLLAKGRLLQLALPAEVAPDAAVAQRSKTTGNLLVTMPLAAGSNSSGKGGGKSDGVLRPAVPRAGAAPAPAAAGQGQQCSRAALGTRELAPAVVSLAGSCGDSRGGGGEAAGGELDDEPPPL